MRRRSMTISQKAGHKRRLVARVFVTLESTVEINSARTPRRFVRLLADMRVHKPEERREKSRG